ncbi:MAG: DMT family transporter [Bacteroidales bacterium]|nr:DMT family transporter [Bacteroidales bacterium]
MANPVRPLLNAHIAVFFFGLAGVVARKIPQQAVIIVAGRVLFASLSLLIILLLRKQSLRILSRKHIFPFLLTGVLLAAHWGLFFWSVKISSIAIGLLTVSTFPVFAAVLEPLFFREPFTWRQLGASFVALVGVVLIIPDFTPGNAALTGALAGTAAGFLFALLSLLNRKYVVLYPGTVLAFYQDTIAFIVLLPFVLVVAPTFSGFDIAALAFLGIFCTGIAHTLFITSLKSLKTATAGILTLLEPVYGVLIAIPLYGEIPGVRTLSGGAVILAITLYISLPKKQSRNITH